MPITIVDCSCQKKNHPLIVTLNLQPYFENNKLYLYTRNRSTSITR